jgi:DMSO/TMAO reductase YedYZ heme-binding membrane subunit
MFFKQFAKYTMLRIESGVFGFLLVVVHIALMLTYTLKFNFSLILSMPVLLAGASAFGIYLAMVATGGAENIKKLGFGKLKLIHRLGYVAFLFAVYHFMSKYPKAATEPFGMVLLLVVAMAIIFQICGAIKTITKKSTG